MSALPSLEPEAMAAMFDGEPSREALELLERTAKAFRVDAAPVISYRHVMHDRQALVRLDLVRRSFVRDAARATLRDGGLPMLAATLKVLSGHRDDSTLKRFQSLNDYPSGSFGKAYADFIRINQFSFPGDVGGPPVPVFRHDCCHVQGGYGSHVNTDLIRDIDPWDHFADPLEMVRERFAIPARGRDPEYPQTCGASSQD